MYGNVEFQYFELEYWLERTDYPLSDEILRWPILKRHIYVINAGRNRIYVTVTAPSGDP